MNILEMVIMAVLIFIILSGVSIPQNVVASIGTIPGIIIIMCIVLYLFTVSPILGVFAMIAGYEVAINTSYTKERTILDELPQENALTPTNQFQITLEETIVNNIVPLVQTTTPTHLNFKCSEDNTYAAANASTYADNAANAAIDAAFTTIDIGCAGNSATKAVYAAIAARKSKLDERNRQGTFILNFFGAE
jgi:hypothetical protein